jgi:hypothetical protein
MRRAKKYNFEKSYKIIAILHGNVNYIVVHMSADNSVESWYSDFILSMH